VVVPTNKVPAGSGERGEVKTRGESSIISKDWPPWQSESSIVVLGGGVNLRQERSSPPISSIRVPRGISTKVLVGSEGEGKVEVGAGSTSPIERITNWGLIVVNIA